MEFDYDVAIIGGAFSSAATALMIKRKHPRSIRSSSSGPAIANTRSLRANQFFLPETRHRGT